MAWASTLSNAVFYSTYRRMDSHRHHVPLQINFPNMNHNLKNHTLETYDTV